MRSMTVSMMILDADGRWGPQCPGQTSAPAPIAPARGVDSNHWRYAVNDRSYPRPHARPRLPLVPLMGSDSAWAIIQGQSDDGVAAFHAALREAFEASGLTQAELIRESGVAQGVVHRLVTGSNAEPEPRTVFKIERALGLQPGDLSHHLGYRPVDTWPAPEVEAAIKRDPSLLPRHRRILFELYLELAMRGN